MQLETNIHAIIILVLCRADASSLLSDLLLYFVATIAYEAKSVHASTSSNSYNSSPE
jgi:hypothetical protein